MFPVTLSSRVLCYGRQGRKCGYHHLSPVQVDTENEKVRGHVVVKVSDGLAGEGEGPPPGARVRPLLLTPSTAAVASGRLTPAVRGLASRAVRAPLLACRAQESVLPHPGYLKIPCGHGSTLIGELRGRGRPDSGHATLTLPAPIEARYPQPPGARPGSALPGGGRGAGDCLKEVLHETRFWFLNILCCD
ncbi:hypothetical protein E2C01_002249 [Portunus trituberculatus]|uniref:Uncharacterized protein n=1 Tax=Portunus trituberculatus TaxID=210409 RepID=A0A5B7CIX5_PORTR|nr:hypothetical protein [Portunus trituberculatus]